MESQQMIFFTLYGGFLSWVCLANIQQGKKVSALQVMVANLTSSVDELKDIIKQMNVRQDLFMKNEIDTLKDLLKTK